jgi:hypothetical protein
MTGFGIRWPIPICGTGSIFPVGSRWCSIGGYSMLSNCILWFKTRHEGVWRC